MNVWSPGFWSQFPYRGVLALFACLCLIIASIVVLSKADGQPISSWTISPTVYLALFMTVLNLLTRFAFNQGATIAWWRKTLHGGSVTDLHHSWSHADGFWSALFAGRRFNFVTLGSIAATLVVIDQPLIQRAVTVTTAQRNSTIDAAFSVAPEIPWGYTAETTGRGMDGWVMSSAMISAFNDYNSQVPLNVSSLGLDGNYNLTGFIDAAGLSARCTSVSTPVDYSGWLYSTIISPISPFSVAFAMLESNANASSQIVMNIAYTNGSNGSSSACTGMRTEKVCFLSPATLRYPVTVTGSTLTLGDAVLNGSTRGFQPSIFSVVDVPGIDSIGSLHHWTVGGLFIAAKGLFSANATYSNSGAIGWTLSLPDTLSNQFLDFWTSKATVENQTAASGVNFTLANTGGFAEPCKANWTDPTTFILTALNSMAFRVAMKAAEQGAPYRNTNASAPAQVASMTATASVPVYQAEYRYLVASAVLSFCMLLFVVPVFAGWWELGRTFSMNPVETAKAFDAPLLAGPGSNAQLSVLVGAVGARRVMLGEVVEVWEAGTAGGARGADVVRRRLRFGDPAEVVPPTKGTLYE